MIETTSGIGDLLQRLRKDGVEAGQAEKQRILRDAEEQAAVVLAEAKKRAQEIVAAAEADAVAKHKQLDAELTLAARDFALRFAERVKKQTVEPLVKARVEQVLADGDALKQIIVALLRDGTGGASITVSPETKSALEAYFAQELARKIEGGQVEIVSESGVTGFRLQRKGDSFTWDVTGEAVAAEVAALVEPSLRKYLQFGSARG
jgi:V/A-type H+-transporting ATPase subunit E